MNLLLRVVGTLVLIVTAGCTGQPPVTSRPPSVIASPATPRPIATTRPSPTEIGSPSSRPLPVPLAAWPLHGNGKASVGDLDLDLLGRYAATPGGIAFDGISAVAVTDGPSPLDSTKSLTLSAWASYADKLVNIPMVLEQGSDTNMAIGFGVAGTDWIFGTSDYDLPGAAGGGAIITTPATMANSWVYLTGVYDRDAGMIRFYINGVLVDQQPASVPFPASGHLIVGGQDRDAIPASGIEPGGWAGAIADVAVYQTALTAEQIAKIFETTMHYGTPPEWTPAPAT